MSENAGRPTVSGNFNFTKTVLASGDGYEIFTVDEDRDGGAPAPAAPGWGTSSARPARS